MADLPIVCTLTPDGLRARREGLLSDLLRQADDHEQLPEGLRLRFTPTSETLATIARAVDAERRCCRFLRFGESRSNPMVVRCSWNSAALQALASSSQPCSRCEHQHCHLRARSLLLRLRCFALFVAAPAVGVAARAPRAGVRRATARSSEGSGAVKGGRRSSSRSVSTISCNFNGGNKNGLFSKHSRIRGWAAWAPPL